MAFVDSKCPFCGNDIQLPDSEEKGYCPFCGEQVLIDDAKALYNTKNEYKREEKKPTKHCAVVDTEECIGCGDCVEVCPNKALKVNDSLDDVCEVDADKCG